MYIIHKLEHFESNGAGVFSPPCQCHQQITTHVRNQPSTALKDCQVSMLPAGQENNDNVYESRGSAKSDDDVMY